jgi:hypothetical protein
MSSQGGLVARSHNAPRKAIDALERVWLPDGNPLEWSGPLRNALGRYVGRSLWAAMKEHRFASSSHQPLTVTSARLSVDSRGPRRYTGQIQFPTPNAQFPTPNAATRLPTPNAQFPTAVGDWKLGVVGRWSLEVGR